MPTTYSAVPMQPSEMPPLADLDELERQNENPTAEPVADPQPRMPVHELNLNDSNQGKTPMQMQGLQKLFMPLCVVVIVAGIGTGVGLDKLHAQTANSPDMYQGQKLQRVPTSDVKVGQIFGSGDEKAFPDNTEGVLQAGGVGGEGTHHLVRPGGDSQNVYLTSSVTDLNKFIGMKVKVWGETNTAKVAGWLMDVGRIQVEELNAAPPETSTAPTSSPTTKTGTTQTQSSDPTNAGD